ncbi:hypothetical protein [Paraburkholderia sp. SIMBA_030]|uniref:hypothetical protein n=1 Tax=Paraburkholderia sp. SIMBA_030 TaxID=3085773 RepID=UPI00397E0B21
MSRIAVARITPRSCPPVGRNCAALADTARAARRSTDRSTDSTGQPSRLCRTPEYRLCEAGIPSI